MKKFFLIVIVAILATNAKAQQVTVSEPEFAEQSLVLTSDSTAVMLPRESASMKSKASASLYLTGIGKVKSRITLKGEKSGVTIKQEPTTRLIIKATDNKTDPKSFISLFKFEVKSNKRQALVAEAGTFTGTSENSLSNIDFDAKKYGEASYLLFLNNLTPGEYGLLFGDPNALTGKNTFKVTTFSVTEESENPVPEKSHKRNGNSDGVY